jgi:hypothetical protein
MVWHLFVNLGALSHFIGIVFFLSNLAYIPSKMTTYVLSVQVFRGLEILSAPRTVQYQEFVL